MTQSSLGPYQIISLLGAGGMGEVYLAEDSRLGRKVALKVLPSHFTEDRERIHRFQQEARAASALSHPNIITIYEIGEFDSRQFIASEFIDGETLRSRLARISLKVSDALEVGTQVASALCAAHEAGIVHRDIKPENIMLRKDRIVKVLDFGLVKLTEQSTVLSEAPTLVQTGLGRIMGTVQYMSPEQARGLTVDARSDVWSLGVVLYEMVGGRVPFEGGAGSDVIASILGREPTPLARYAPDVPTELEWIIKKALRKDRDERYQTTRELLADLKNLNQRLEFEKELERTGDPSGTSAKSGFTPPARNDAETQTQARPFQKAIDSLAILPLINNSADQSKEYFSDGITESMINALSQLPHMRVMAWSTVARYKTHQVDPRQVGRELNVRAVLTGRMMEMGERLVIKTEMVDTADGAHLWGESYICKPSEILDLETEISSQICETLVFRLTSDERKQLARHYTDNVEAYHAYLRGRYFWNRRTDEGVRKAIEYFKAAIDNDPAYALAYAGLADSYLVLGGFGIATLSPQEAFPKACEAAARALEIDDSVAEAHASLAYCLANYEWKWPAAEKEFKRTLALKPGYATAHHWYGFIYLAAMGQLDQALAETKQALDLDPLSLPVSSNIGLLLYLARRHDEAIAQFRKTLEMDENFVYTHWEMALAYEEKAMYDEAIAALQKATALSGTTTLPLALLARTYALCGKRIEALALLDEIKELSRQRYVSPYRVAAIHAALGDKERAFEWLDLAYEGRDGWLIWLKVDPVMDDLRSDERYVNLMRRVGLTSEI